MTNYFYNDDINKWNSLLQGWKYNDYKSKHKLSIITQEEVNSLIVYLKQRDNQLIRLRKELFYQLNMTQSLEKKMIKAVDLLVNCECFCNMKAKETSILKSK